MKTRNDQGSGSRACCAAVIAAAVLVATTLPATAQQQARETRLIKVTNVSLSSAHQLAISVCNTAAGMVRGIRRTNEEPEEPCADVRMLERENMLAISATPEVIARLETLLGEFDRLPVTRSFQIIVLAANGSDARSDAVPQNVLQALEDIRDFLPYSSYSVIGSGWVRTSEYGETTLPGPEPLIAELQLRPNADPTAAVLVEHFSISKRAVETVIEQGVAAQQWRNRPILRSTFAIEPGETLVVGTSKLDGDGTAMVVLLTAVQN